MDPITNLRELARHHGVQESYLDNEGNLQAASPEALAMVLQGLGVHLPGPDAAWDALIQARHEYWNELVSPITVAWDGRGDLELRLSRVDAQGRARVRIETEEGRSLGRDVELGEAELIDRITLDDSEYLRLRVPVVDPKADALAMGRHQLFVRLATGATGQTLVVSAPRRVYVPDRDRTWGVFAPLYSIRSRRNMGIGDITDLAEVTRWVHDQGGSVVGTLPMLAAFLDEPCEPSPYAPVSRLAWNELYLDVTALPEFSASADARAAMARFGPDIERLEAAERVDYRTIYGLKRQVLEACAHQLFTRASGRRAAFEAFVRSRPELDQYARFRAVHERLRQPWSQWPDALRNGTVTDEDYDPERHRFHLYCQWAIHEQLDRLSHEARGGGSGLYLDLPVGVHGEGFDVWRHRDLYARALATGAPPDALFDGGQNWAFPPFHPQAIRRDGYRHVSDILRNHLRYAGVLRIDHVMGLHRLYTIPQGASAKQGVYVRYEPAEWYALLSLESHRAGTLLLGENLGTVPDEVTRSMQEHGVHGMHVVQYATRPDEPKNALPPAESGEIASINTHDMPPFASFWNGIDIEQRRSYGWIDDQGRLGELTERARLRDALREFLSTEVALEPDAPPSEVLEGTLVHLGRGDAHLVLVTLEDLWGETRAHNVPGTWNEHPNWQHRNRYPFETWQRLPEVTGPLARLDAARRGSSARGRTRYDANPLRADDLCRWTSGEHTRIYEVLGAHPDTVEGVEGSHFALWAPRADSVSVVGPFNLWDRGRSPLQRRGDTGIWAGFVAGVGPGDTYEFSIVRGDSTKNAADPVGFASESPPRTASVVTTLEHPWGDQAWMQQRKERSASGAPISIYEVHLPSWRRVPEDGHRPLTYRELAPQLAEYCQQMGFTHVEFLPITERPFHDPLGYECTGFFAPSRRQGSPRDFMVLVDTLHQHGIGVIMDWVADHFADASHGLSRLDAEPLYEPSEEHRARHLEGRGWRFDFSKPQVRSFLISSAMFWLERYHIDALRLPDLSSLLFLDHGRRDAPRSLNRHGGPEDLDALGFVRELHETIGQRFADVTTFAHAEQAWPMVSRPTYLGGLGFGYKWDARWTADMLRYLMRPPVHRRWHQAELPFRSAYAFSESHVLPLSHQDIAPEQYSLLARMPGPDWERFANLRLLFGYMFAQPGKKLVFMGQEFGQERPWSPEHSLDWHLLDRREHAGVARWVRDLNALMRREPALHQLDADSDGFEWVDFSDVSAGVVALSRKATSGPPVLVVCNFTPATHRGYRIGVSESGLWRELANSDAEIYGGSGTGNCGAVVADPICAHGRTFSLSLCIPPLGVLFLTPGSG